MTTINLPQILRPNETIKITNKDDKIINIEYPDKSIFSFIIGKWINVKDELPLYKQCILVLFNRKHVIKIITEAVYRGEYEKDIHVFRIMLTREDIECKRGEYITHWMPLPESPMDDNK